MPEKTDRILKTINELQDYLAKLDEAQAYSKDDFFHSWNIYFSVERLLQLAVECIIEIGEDIISIGRYKKPQTYRETFAILAQKEILDIALADQMIGYVDMRNKLVHAYATVPRERIYELCQQGTASFRRFIAAVKQFFQQKSIV